MSLHVVTFNIDTADLSRFEDEHIAALWHIAQANPAPWGTPEAGQLASRIGFEIIRRWLARAPVAMYHHQAGDHAARQRIDSLPKEPQHELEARNSQHVVKAEGESPDATDRETCANASPDGGPMGAGQAAAAAPACWRCTQPATCKDNGFCSIERRDLEDL